MSIYMKATDMQGNVTAQNFQNWIELESLHFGGISNSVTTKPGNTQNRVNGHPVMGDISIVKPSDSSSIALFEAANSQKAIPNVEIDFVSAGNPAFVYEKLKLTNVLISAHSYEHVGEIGKTIEFYTLNPETIERTYTPRTSSNTAGNPQTTGYNLSTARKM